MSSSATFEQARDDVFSRIAEAWRATGAVTENVPILWPSVEDEEDEDEKVSDDGGSYAEATIHFGRDADTGMGDGERKHTVPGTVVVDLYERKNGEVQLGLKAGEIFCAACSGRQTPRGVIFRNREVRDAGEHGPYRRTRMSAAFEFDQVR